MSFVRLFIASAVAAALAGCSGGNLGSVFGPNPGGGSLECQTGTQVELANPYPNQSGVPTNIGQITMVANGNGNTLYQTYNQWYVTLVDQYGDTVTGGNLTLVDGRTLPHPYNSDFYYGSGIGQLRPGVTWNAYLNEQNGGYCQAVPLNSFST